jgi:hypothetical protein
MRNISGQFRHVCQLVSTLLSLIADAVCYLGLCLCPSPRLAAENLLLCEQLALYQERQVRPRRAAHATRMALIWLGQGFDWRRALGIVKPETFIAWHRQGFRLFWRFKANPGRLALPKDLRALIRRMALENPTWGQERIANELLLKLGLRVSPRAVRKYMPSHCVGGPGKRGSSQRWSMFICNNAGHLYRILKEWVAYYHGGRPHRSLGPSIPQPPSSLPTLLHEARPQLPSHLSIVENPILGGLHHDYRLQKKAA